MLQGVRAQGSGGKRSSSRGAARLLETYLAPSSALLEGLANARFTAGIGVGPPLKRHARAAAAEMSKLVRAALEAQGGEGGSTRSLAYGRLFYLLEVEELLPSDILSIAKVLTVSLHRAGAAPLWAPWLVDRPFLGRVVPAVATLAWRLLDALKDRANLARIYTSFDLYACLTLLGQLRTAAPCAWGTLIIITLCGAEAHLAKGRHAPPGPSLTNPRRPPQRGDGQGGRG